jgi:hypothetical protein
MSRRLGWRLWRPLVLVSLCAVVIALADAAAPASAGTSNTALCDTRANNTPAKLLPCIRTDDLWKHMQAFQAIADANPGPDGMPSLSNGEPGYKAAVDYVAQVMKQAGYDVTIQTFKLFYFNFVGVPAFSEVSPTGQSFKLVTDWTAAKVTGGSATADVQPAGGIILPPTPTPSSASGCSASDFTGFVAGRIALIQAGTCGSGVKVLNAQAAGATGVIIFNEGNPGRTAVTGAPRANPPTLRDAAGNRITPAIPVALTSFDIGSRLFNEYQQAAASGTALPRVNLDIHGVADPNRDSYNVIADSKGGDPNHVVVVDAHLDAVWGAGILDNASGSSTILDIAQQMRNVNPRNKLRFIWFGGEELGALGSAAYVNNLSDSEFGQIGYDLDADVTATPNYIVGVLDPAGVNLFGRTPPPAFPQQVYAPSLIARDQQVAYFSSQGLNHEFFSPVGTDAFNFNAAGVPASGVLTGQDCCNPAKSQAEVDMFGGHLGNYDGNIPSFDGGCVDNAFRWCDNISNNDPSIMTFVSRAFGNAVVQMAYAKLGNPYARTPLG